MISIVVPARNEAAVIARTLEAMTQGAAAGEFDIVVVCNACSDNTAEIARGFGAGVRVIETEIPGKPHALNLGDAAARAYPRIYADADVVITPPAIRALAASLARGDIFAAAPRPQVNLDGCSWAVRAFYAIRDYVPSSREGIGGSGIYALSEEGRRRFGEFPNLVADDSYVRIQFQPHERETLHHVHSIVFPPRRIRDLITVRARAHYGNFELARLHPDLWKNKGESNEGALLRLFKYPNLWPKLFVYGMVTILARRRARSRIRSSHDVWERDDTSRRATLP